MSYFGIPVRNGLPIGLGTVAPLGINTFSPFSPASFFANGEQGWWYDPSNFATLFQDSAGTTPVTAVGQPVGLQLDSRDLSYSVFFNGTSDAISTAASSAFNFGTGDFAQSAWINPTNTTGVKIIIDCRASSVGNPGPVVYLNGAALASAKNSNDVINSGGTVLANVWSFVELTRTSGNWRIFLNGALVAGPTSDTVDFTSNSPAVIGRNANSASQFYDGYISNARVVKGTGGVTSTVPTSALTAVPGTGILTCGVSWSGNPAIVSAGTANKLNPYTTGTGNHRFQTNSANRPVVSALVNLFVGTATLATQSVTTRATAHTLTFTGAGSITLTGTAIGIYTAGTHSVTTTAGSLTATVLGTVTQADLRETNVGVGLPAYQAVVTSTNYDATGFPVYIKPNGSNQFMQTNSINFTATDKMTVWQGVRKVIDDTDRVLIELSASVNSNNGSFGISAPSQLSGGYVGKYVGSLRGTAQSTSELTTYAAPITNVLSASYDIAGATIATESIYRVNGGTPTETNNGVTAGTGNFGNYPAYFYARNGALLFFNGNDYGSIARGAASTAAQIANGETYINSLTKAY
jgi:hypothetical protein